VLSDSRRLIDELPIAFREKLLRQRVPVFDRQSTQAETGLTERHSFGPRRAWTTCRPFDRSCPASNRRLAGEGRLTLTKELEHLCGFRNAP
jgi:hypothetical protein